MTYKLGCHSIFKCVISYTEVHVMGNSVLARDINPSRGGMAN